MAAAIETKIDGFDSAEETPEIAAGENLTKKSEGKWKPETLKSLRFFYFYFFIFIFLLIGKGLVEFGYIIFGLNGAQWFLVKTQ